MIIGSDHLGITSTNLKNDLNYFYNFNYRNILFSAKKINNINKKKFLRNFNKFHEIVFLEKKRE